MKILILGASGMIGHKLFNYFSSKYETFGTVRTSKKNYAFENDHNIIDYVDLRNFNMVKNNVENLKPSIVLNCTGIVKQISESASIEDQILLNSIIPHLLAELSILMEFKLISFSSDCIFSGLRGDYTEDDISDASDIYGLTKSLGEVNSGNSLTIRTSTIGLELAHKHGLIEWFLSRKGEIQGFDNAIYTGLTTTELAKYLENILLYHHEINGVFQMVASKITKYDLLKRLSVVLNKTDIKIIKNVDFACDRSLVGSRLNDLTGYRVPSWKQMIDDLALEILERNAKI